MASTDEILTVFNMLKANYMYAVRDMTPEQVSDLQVLWCELLPDISGDILKASALQHVSESRWFPSIAELREHAMRIMYPRRNTAIEAWGEVVRQFHVTGHCGTPQFSDPITERVVREIGWNELCMSENMSADRARFIEGYNAAVKREQQEFVMLPQVRDVMRQLAEARRIPQIKSSEAE